MHAGMHKYAALAAQSPSRKTNKKQTTNYSLRFRAAECHHANRRTTHRALHRAQERRAETGVRVFRDQPRRDSRVIPCHPDGAPHEELVTDGPGGRGTPA